MRLLRRPAPYQNESLKGYLCRVAETNGYDSPYWLLEFANCSPWLATRKQSLQRLSHLFGVLPQQLSYRCYWPCDGKPTEYQFGQTHVLRHMINLTRPRICPHCLSEGKFRRQIWDMSVIACCPDHGTALIDYCPTCLAGFQWQHAKVEECFTCGQRLSQIKTSQAPTDALELTTYISRRVFGYPKAASTFMYLDQVELQEIMSAITFIGSHACGRGSGQGLQLATRLSAGATLRVVSEAAKILKNWPEGFYELLDRIKNAEPPVRPGVGLLNDFGPLYETITKTLRSRQYKFLQTVFFEYLRTHWDGGFLSPKNHRTGVYASKRFMTRAQATNLLGARPETVSRLIKARRLKAVQRPMGQRTLTLVDRESILHHQLTVQDHVTFTQLCHYLGLSEKPVRELIARGHVVPVAGISTNASRPLVYSIEEVLRLLGSIPCAGTIIAKRDCHVSFRHSCRKLSAIGMSVADAVELILCKRLVPAGLDTDQNGFSQCLFNPQIIDQLVNKSPIAPPGWLTVPAAATSMRLKQEVVYKLVNNGHLKAVSKIRRGRQVRLISQAEIDRFQRKYTQTTSLAKTLETSPKQAILKFRKQGILPAIGPQTDGNRQTFFERSKLPKHLR